ncbi:hypothetical protein HYC85_016912 [Camellia sinensis]|uniref:Uncharacterized protein n=1 Tax=Camellia sinensis TaxID=4442 RepID=A0A7J7H4C4_CAMSI|nr:hypothetical protein HYC85_016912 [Camellia sinensis]
MSYGKIIKQIKKTHNGMEMQGQAQAHRGVVINMESFSGMEMQVYIGKHPYVDVYGGKLWINILHEIDTHNSSAVDLVLKLRNEPVWCSIFYV